VKPNPRFWNNLQPLTTLLHNGSMIQYSVLKTGKKRGALAAVKIAKHYGAARASSIEDMADLPEVHHIQIHLTRRSEAKN